MCVFAGGIAVVSMYELFCYVIIDVVLSPLLLH